MFWSNKKLNDFNKKNKKIQKNLMSNHKWLQTAFKATILFFTLFIIENSQKEKFD